MTPSSHPDRILRALARATDAESPALTWLELNAELPSMLAGDLSVNLEKLEREGLVEKERQAGIRGRPWGWSLTDAGRKRAEATKAKLQPKAEAAARRPISLDDRGPVFTPLVDPFKPASTVADLVQEIKAEQDAGRVKGLDTNGDARLVKLVEEANRAVDEKYDFRPSHEPERKLDLTLGSDGMLEIVVPGTEFSMLLTPGQTSQLGEFMTKTAGVWQSVLTGA